METPKEIKKFYDSKAWKKAKELTFNLACGICAKCGGVGTEVHHIIPLTLSNYQDLKIALDQSNLMLLCKSCHDSMRAEQLDGIRSDITFDDNGNVVKKKVPPH